MKEKQFPVLTFEGFKCHTESVERFVKLIYEVAMKCNGTARDWYIPDKFQEREKLPTFHNMGQ